MGTIQGIDKRGRPYTIVNGKHIKTGGGDTPSPRTADSRITAAPKNALRKFLRRWFGAAHSGEEVKSSIRQLTKTKFNLWFSIAAKTSVGRQGRLYAMRYYLKSLHDTGDPKQFETPKGDLDFEKFAAYIKHHHDLDITGAGEGETPEQGKIPNKSAGSDDAEILKIVHEAGLDAGELRNVLKSYKKSNNSNP